MYLFQGDGLDSSVAIMHNFQSLDFYSHLVGLIVQTGAWYVHITYHLIVKNIYIYTTRKIVDAWSMWHSESCDNSGEHGTRI